MTLKQLRFLREIARQSLNMSEAAAALHASQPGVSRHVQMLERELGVDLLIRRRNRVLGFTDTGRAVLDAAQRLLGEADTIRLIAEEAREDGGGRLTVATSHLHARYTLLGPIKAFRRGHPQVELLLQQADPDDIARLVESGDADIGISTELAVGHLRLVQLPGPPMGRSAIMPKDHPLAGRRRLSLSDLARYPLIGYHARSRGGQLIAGAFRSKGIEARFVVSASDADVIKAYVAEGLGVAVVPTLALDAGADRGLKAIDVTALFPRSVMSVSLRRDAYLRRYLTDFIRLAVPRLDRETVQRALRASR